MPYLIDKLLGPVAAIIAAVTCFLGGIGFLIAGHLHRNKAPVRRRSLMATIGMFALVGGAVGVLIGGIYGSVWFFVQKHQRAELQETVPPSPQRAGVAGAADTLSTIAKQATTPARQTVPSVTPADTSPSFRAQIEYVYAVYIADRKQTVMFLLIDVKNDGAPSAAYGWKLAVKSANLNLGNVPYIRIPDEWRIGQEGQLTVVFHHKECLYEKAVKQIRRGDLLTGWLPFAIPGDHWREIIYGKPLLTVTFQDYTDRLYEAKLTVEGPATPRSLPGAEIGFVRDPNATKAQSTPLPASRKPKLHPDAIHLGSNSTLEMNDSSISGYDHPVGTDDHASITLNKSAISKGDGQGEGGRNLIHIGPNSHLRMHDNRIYGAERVVDADHDVTATLDNNEIVAPKKQQPKEPLPKKQQP